MGEDEKASYQQQAENDRKRYCEVNKFLYFNLHFTYHNTYVGACSIQCGCTKRNKY